MMLIGSRDKRPHEPLPFPTQSVGKVPGGGWGADVVSGMKTPRSLQGPRVLPATPSAPPQLSLGRKRELCRLLAVELGGTGLERVHHAAHCLVEQQLDGGLQQLGAELELDVEIDVAPLLMRTEHPV